MSRVQKEEWRRFIPGVRMYKGKRTLFYNGEILYEGDDFNGNPLVYDWQERLSWKVIVVLPGVEVIPAYTFHMCDNVETVIMADSVKRVQEGALSTCDSLKVVRLSRNLEFIGIWAFQNCKSLTSIFIPPSCQEICMWAFDSCKRLLILGMPQHVQLGKDIFQDTALIKKSPFELNEHGQYAFDDDEMVTQWIRSINDEEVCALHRACASFNPLSEIIYALVNQNGIKAMRIPNTIGITPSQYLEANTFTEISEKDIINRYVLDMMGEVI